MSVGQSRAARVVLRADEEPILNRGNVNAEARGSLVAIAVDAEGFDARPVDIVGPVTFYARYDEQAGRLRCSVASVEPDDLPVRGRFRFVDDPAPVLALMAPDAQPDVVPWGDLRKAPLRRLPARDERIEYSL